MKSRNKRREQLRKLKEERLQHNRKNYYYWKEDAKIIDDKIERLERSLEWDG